MNDDTHQASKRVINKEFTSLLTLFKFYIYINIYINKYIKSYNHI